MEDIRAWGDSVAVGVEKAFIGKRQVIEKILVSVLARGHVLLEDVPGVGKTVLAHSLARALGGSFKRIQCTPDLLPADIIGVSIYNQQEGRFRFRRGPLHASFVLVDEINRATPRTQSALLEAMAEGQVSVEGKRMQLPKPFFLIATENPIEFEGTFPLPEAQKDRFLLSLDIGYPARVAEENILEMQRRTTHPVFDVNAVSDTETLLKHQEKVVSVHMDARIRGYIMDIVEKTRADVRFRLGVSPRGTLALYASCQALAALRGRNYIVPEDVKELVVPVFSKRVLLKPDYLMKGHTTAEALAGVLESIPMPVLKEKV